MHFSLIQALGGLLAVSSMASALGIPIDHADVSSAGTDLLTSLDERGIPVPGNLACYNQQKGCKNMDVLQKDANKYAGDICAGKRFKGVVAKPGWEGTAGWARNPYWLSYNVKVEWRDGCTMPGDGTMKIDLPAPGVTCHDLAYTTWKNCKGNGGRGGKIEFGCLDYHYNLINGDEAGPEYCGDVPFGNWTH